MNICIVDRGGIIPAKEYGGTERVIWGLGKNLHQMGHKVRFLVPEGSSCNFAEVSFLQPQLNLDRQIPEDTDVVHLNFFPSIPVSKPYLITCHGNMTETEAIDKNTVFISKNQAERYNGDTFVHNGLNWDDYPAPNLSLPRDGFHFLGKAGWKVKNLTGAIQIAETNNEKLHVIGGKRWTGRNIKRGFKHLFNHNIHFHGLLGDSEKTKIMQGSKGLIFPVLWHEPFGLVIIESLYAGCAVFGTPNGALPELLTPQTGSTGTSVKEIAEKMQEFKYDPKLCHEYAVENFNSGIMATEYLKLYERVLDGETLNTNLGYNKEKNEMIKFG